MLAVDGNTSGVTSSTKSSAFSKLPSALAPVLLKPKQQQLLDFEPVVYCWALWDGMDSKFQDYLAKHLTTLTDTEGVPLVWYQYRNSALSINVEKAIGRDMVDISFSDFPCLLFIDSFSKPRDIYVYKIDQASEESITSDLRFMFDMVRRHFHPPQLQTAAARMTQLEIRQRADLVTEARRNFLLAAKPQAKLRKLKAFCNANQFNLVNMIFNVIKLFG